MSINTKEKPSERKKMLREESDESLWNDDFSLRIKSWMPADSHQPRVKKVFSNPEKIRLRPSVVLKHIGAQQQDIAYSTPVRPNTQQAFAKSAIISPIDKKSHPITPSSDVMNQSGDLQNEPQVMQEKSNGNFAIESNIEGVKNRSENKKLSKNSTPKNSKQGGEVDCTQVKAVIEMLPTLTKICAEYNRKSQGCKSNAASENQFLLFTQIPDRQELNGRSEEVKKNKETDTEPESDESSLDDSWIKTLISRYIPTKNTNCVSAVEDDDKPGQKKKQFGASCSGLGHVVRDKSISSNVDSLTKTTEKNCEEIKDTNHVQNIKTSGNKLIGKNSKNDSASYEGERTLNNTQRNAGNKKNINQQEDSSVEANKKRNHLIGNKRKRGKINKDSKEHNIQQRLNISELRRSKRVRKAPPRPTLFTYVAINKEKNENTHRGKARVTKLPTVTEDVSPVVNEHNEDVYANSEHNSEEESLFENTPNGTNRISHGTDMQEIHNDLFSSLPNFSNLKDNNGVVISIGMTTDDGAHVGLLRFEPNAKKIPVISEEHSLAFAVIEGHARIYVSNKCTDVGPSDSFHVPPGAVYSIHNLDKNKRLMLFFVKYISDHSLE